MKRSNVGKAASVLSIVLAAGMLLSGCGGTGGTGSTAASAAGSAGSASAASKSEVSGASSEAASGSSEHANESKNYRIGFSAYAMQQEWYQNISAGAEAEAKALGIQLDVIDADTNATTQLESIENFITQGVDAIIISPGRRFRSLQETDSPSDHPLRAEIPQYCPRRLRLWHAPR